MDNREDIEVLDDFEFDNDDLTDNNKINTTTNTTTNNINNNIDKTDKINNEIEEKEQLENPVVEMINNKTTMKLIGIMLIVLFLAVFLMPKFFELIGNI